jgi:hypothetical protein
MPAKRKRPTLRVVGVSPEIPDQRIEQYARIALRSIKQELAAADFFTREDCLFLSVFQHVSTITRYNSIRLAVILLIERGELHAFSRTHLCLPSKLGKIDENEKLHEKYLPTITKLVRGFPAGAPIAVMDVVAKWSQDQHLTTNSKRVAVRLALKHLAKDGLLKRDSGFGYTSLRDAA